MKKVALLYLAAASCFVLTMSALLGTHAIASKRWISPAFYHSVPFSLFCVFAAVGFGALFVKLATTAQEYQEIRKDFKKYFGQAAAARNDRFLMQPYVNATLQWKARHFEEACQKQTEFLKKWKDARLMTSSSYTEACDERERIENAVRRDKNEFWEAWTSAKLNGFKVFPRVSDYQNLRWEQ